MSSGLDRLRLSDARSFQYFPESITDSKVNNYQAKEIPGLSHPLYQWTAGGPRELSFTAVFSSDLPLVEEGKPDRSKSLQQRNVDVDAAIAWIQSFQYPEYSNPNLLSGKNLRPKPPLKILLTLPNVRINMGRPQINDDDMYCILLSAEVSRESFFPDGTTRLAKIELSFAEVIQLRGSVHPHDASSIRTTAMDRYKLGPDEGIPFKSAPLGFTE